MSQYWTDFSEYITGNEPSDWTERWQSYDHIVEDDVGAEGGKLLHVSPNASTVTSTHLFSWDAIDGDANRDDVEVLMKVRFNDLNNTNKAIAMFRANNSFSNREGYACNYQGEIGYLTIEGWDAGSYFLINNQTGFSASVDTWYWIRARVNGNTLSLKRWQDGDPEPSTWDNETTDSTVTGVGWVGYGTYQDTTDLDIDIFSVGTNGDTAPTDDPTGGGETVSVSVGLSQNMDTQSSAGANASTNTLMDQNMGMTDGGQANVGAGVSVNQDMDVSDENRIDVLADLSVSYDLQISESAVANAKSSMSVDSVYGVTANGLVTSFASLSQAISHALTIDRGDFSVEQVAVSVSHNLDLVTEGDADSLAGFMLNSSQNLSAESQAKALAEIQATTQFALQAVAKALANTGLSIDMVTDISISGTTVTTNVTFPDGRTIAIKFDLRDLSITEDNRIIPIESDNRNIPIN